jgi:hypothetical protein
MIVTNMWGGILASEIQSCCLNQFENQFLAIIFSIVILH